MSAHFITVFIILFSTIFTAKAQELILSGPMQGYTEFRTAKIWVEVAPEAIELSLEYGKASGSERDTIHYTGKLGQEFNPVTFDLTNLEPGTKYSYTISTRSEKNKSRITTAFYTQDLWMYRKPAPDFSFLAGSCSYIKDPNYERPGAEYGSDGEIYFSMSKTKADFMLWLGDNWYTRDVDYYSRWGLWNRAQFDRSHPDVQLLLRRMPHYAIWDDHDFGANNFGASYVYKDESRKVFMNYWANPSYGMDGKGIYTQFAYSDAAFFMLDDRTWRSSDDMKDSVNGQPNPEKTMLGRKQMSWLKDALLQSRYSTFKIIAIGSQVLNSYSPFDCFYHYPAEHKELLDFIADNKIEGVIFMTGDRHHSEIIKMERKGHYTLYDITTSPLTSRTYPPAKQEEDIPTRVLSVPVVHNYSKISITGESKQRKLSIVYYDKTGKQIADWSINEKELKEP